MNWQFLNEDEMTEQETRDLTNRTADMEDWGAGEMHLLGRSAEGHIVAGTIIVKRPTEYIGIVIDVVEDYEDDERRTQVRIAVAPITDAPEVIA